MTYRINTKKPELLPPPSECLCFGSPFMETYEVDTTDYSEGSTIKSMTAILRILTPSGFVIAADGRQRTIGADGQSKTCDEKKKIFVTQFKRMVVAYALTGQVSNQDESFSIVKLASDAAQQLSDKTFDSVNEYLYKFSRIIKEPLSAALKDGQFKPVFQADHPDPNERDTICRIIFAGYYREAPVYGCIRLRHPLKILKIEISAESARRGVWMVDGPQIGGCVLDWDSQDPRLASFRCERNNDTLEWATESARRFIRACETDEAQKMDPNCKDVGGQIHAVAISRDGFKWIEVNQSPAKMA